MPTTITVKNIPDAIHLALKQAAETSHRSLSDEVIARLGQSLQTHADCAHAIRQSLGKVRRAKIDIVKMIRADRDRR